MRARPWLFVVGVMVLFAPSARAGEKVAIGSFRTAGERMTEPARGALRSSLSGGLVSAGFELISDAEVARLLAKTPGLEGCDTAACIKRLGEVLGVKLVIKASVELIGSAHYAASLQAVDASDGRELATVEDVCEVCNLNEANESLSNAAAALRGKLKPPEAPQPPPNQPPPLPPPPPTTMKTHLERGFGIGLLAVGAVSMIVGFAEVGVNGSRACTVAPGQLDCPQRIDSTNGQVFGFVTGSLGLVAGGVLTYFAYRKPSRVALAPIIGPGIAAVQLKLGF